MVDVDVDKAILWGILIGLEGEHSTFVGYELEKIHHVNVMSCHVTIKLQIYNFVIRERLFYVTNL